MSNVFRFTFVIMAFAFVIAGCSSGERPVATVNGEAISLDQVAAINPEVGMGVSTAGEDLREVLVALVIETALLQAANNDYGLAINESRIEERIANPPPRWQGLFVELEAANAPAAQVRSQAELTLIRDGVVSQLIEEEGLDQFMEENVAATTRLCLQVLVFLDEELADDSATRLRGGEDFLTVAEEAAQAAPGRVDAADNESTCPEYASALNTTVVDAALDAEMGKFVGPIATELGLVVVRVTERHDPLPGGENIMEHLDSRRASDYFTPWFNNVVRVARIEIDPAIGSWSETGLGIIAPE